MMIKKQIKILEGLAKSGKEFVRRFGQFLRGSHNLEPLVELPAKAFRKPPPLLLFKRSAGLIETNIVKPKLVRSTVRRLEYAMTQDVIKRMRQKLNYRFLKNKVVPLTKSARRARLRTSYKLIRPKPTGRHIRDVMSIQGASIAWENLHKQSLNKLEATRVGFRPRVRRQWIGSIS